MTKPALLFLSHRIPFPPNKGDKIRSFNLLKALARDYRVYLGTFVDDPEDWQYEKELREYCAEVFLLGLTRKRKYGALTGFLSGEALSLPYYRFSQMQTWVDRKIAEQDISRAFVFSSAMAQYVSGEQYQPLHRVVDFVDVDSEKWRAYSRQRRFPVSWVYRREAEKLFEYDKDIAHEFDASLFVTKEEASLFQSLIAYSSEKIDYLNNGVDYHYFSPELESKSPYRAADKVMVFTGAMDYWANVDAVKWFAENVFPLIKRRVPEAKFYIVGARPSDEVRKLESNQHIKVVGAVKDIRPFITHARLAVAPMRIARGVQNKVLEAMALETPFVATSAAMEGINNLPGQRLCDDDLAFAEQCIDMLSGTNQSDLVALGREQILRDFNWDKNLLKLEALLGDREDSGDKPPGKYGDQGPHLRLVGETG